MGISSLIILPVLPVFAADGTLEGEIGVSGVFTDIDGSKAKFNEYRDLMDGVYGGAWLHYDTEDFFVNGQASDVGYDTQKYEVEGGMYGKFKAYFDYQEIPHNLTFGAQSFYSGASSNNLTFSPPQDLSVVADWNTFDYGTKRKQYGGGLSFELLKPFFFELSTPNEKRTGTYPIGAAVGSNVSPGSSIVEIPQRINYTTNAFNVTAGYAQNPYFAAVNFFYSQFNNANSAQYFDRPTGSPIGAASTPDAYSLPPDNRAYKLAFKGSAKLPYNSQFSVNLATGRAKSDDNVLLATSPIFGQVFNGEIETNNYEFVFITNPVHLLKARINYKFYERNNKSDQLTIDDVTNDLFGYEKSKFGIDLNWSLPAKFNLGTAYTYLNTTRDYREDISENQDDTLSAELKWKGLNFMTPKVRYEFMHRTADHGEFDPTDVEAYVWRFDAAPKDRNTFKASVDIFPLSTLNFTIGYKYVDVDYKDTVLGLRSTRSNQVNVDAGYTIGKIAQLNAYFDYELNKDYQFQRTFTSTGSPDPNSTPNTSNYNWDATIKDKSYSWGGGAEVYLVPDLVTLLLQFDDVKSNGDADFTYLFAGALASGLTNDNIDIGSWDDYRLNCYSAKIRYTPTKQYTFTLGYAYERFKYNDAQLDTYLLVQGSNYLSGAYANPNYDAHVVFLSAMYRF